MPQMAEPLRHAWTTTLSCLAAGLVVLFALYGAEFLDMMRMWAVSETYRSLAFVPLISVYFIWLRLPAVRRLIPRPAPVVLWGILPCALLWLLGAAVQVTILRQIAAAGMLQVLLFGLLGREVWRRLMFPLLLLVLMVPVGEEFLESLLVRLTAWVTISGLQLLGMPVTTDGAVFVAGGVAYSIIRECAGLRFVLANLLVSLAFANLAFYGLKRRVAYVVAGLVVAVIANNLRTISVVLITAAGVDLASNHLAYGWFVFGAVMLLQMVVGLRFRDEPPVAVAAASSRRTIALPRRGTALAMAAALLVGMLLPPVYANRVLEHDAGPGTSLCLAQPAESFMQVAEDAMDWQPRFPGADLQLSGRMEQPGQIVDVFIAYYWRQSEGRELVAWENSFHDGRWRVLAHADDSVSGPGTGAGPVASQRLLGPDGERRMVWYRYWIDGRFTTSPVAAKLHQARAVLMAGERRAAVVALSLLETGNLEQDRQVLERAFVEGPDFDRVLGEVTIRDAALPCTMP